MTSVPQSPRMSSTATDRNASPTTSRSFSYTSEGDLYGERSHTSSNSSVDGGLTTAELGLLVGEEYTKAAIYPAGSNLVSIVSSPVPTFFYSTEPIPAPKPVELRRSRTAVEEIVLDILPMEAQQDPLELSEDPGTAIDDWRSSEIEKPEIDKPEIDKPETDKPPDSPPSLESLPPSSPKPFSVLRCFADPKAAACPSKSKGFARCHLTFGSVTIFPNNGQPPESRVNSLLSSSASAAEEDFSPQQLPVQSETQTIARGVRSKSFYETGNSLLLFLVASYSDHAVYRTRVVAPTQHSTCAWNETIELQIHSPKSSISFELYDKEFYVDDGEPFEDELLAGVNVQIEDLSYGESYTISIDVNMSPRPTIGLKAAARRVEAALELRKEEEEDEAGNKLPALDNKKGTPKLQPITNGEAYAEPQITPPLCIRVQVHLLLIPATSKYLSTLGALGLPSSPQAISSDDLSVASTTVNVEKIRYSIFRLKHILWDSVLVPLGRCWDNIQSWKSIPHSATLLIAVWFYFWHPRFRLSLFLSFTIALLVFLPSVLPALSPRGKSQDSTDWYLQSAVSGYHEPDESTTRSPTRSPRSPTRIPATRSHYPSSAAQPFLGTVITDGLLLQAKRLEPKIVRFAATAERVYRLVRDEEFAKKRESIALVVAIFAAFSISNPTFASKVFRSSLQLLVLMFFFVTWSPVQVLLRLTVAFYRGLILCLNYNRQSTKIVTQKGLSLKTFR